MKIKLALVLAPIVVIAFLLQSFFWVPTFEEETIGNPERLREFIAGSIGDASLLNPILSADTASSQIEGLVFEGLLDRDENLRFRGRLAESWNISEEAYFFVNGKSSIPGLGPLAAEDLVRFIRSAKISHGSGDISLQRSLENIEEISILPALEYERVIPENVKGESKGSEEVKVRVKAPARIKLLLKRVDQDLFENLKKILGSQYFSSFNAKDYILTFPSISDKRAGELASRLLPAVEHNPVLLFHLRKGVKFHDGHEFDAYDVKFTYEAIMNRTNLSPRIADYEPVKAVEVIDRHTVRVFYKRLYSPALGTWSMGILPEHLLNRENMKAEAERRGIDPEDFSIRQSAFNRHPVGCGPFVFKEWKSDQYITLNRFDDYWEGPANYRRYIFRIIPDLLTQEMEFYAGTIDSYGVQPHQVERLRTDPRFQSFSGPSFGYTYIGYNIRREPFDDPRVRKALGMAINTENIIKYVLQGQGERITGPFVKQTDYYNKRVRPLSYDPEASLDLLEEAGWRRNKEGWLEKDGRRFRFTLISNSGNEIRKACLSIAQASWKRLGIDVRTDLLEWSVFLQERVNKNDFDALVLGWSMGIEPDLYQIWHSSQTKPGQLNFVGFRSSEADRLIIKIRQEYDHEKQVAYCHRLHEIIARQQPYTFLYVGRWTAVLDKRIVVRETGPDGAVRYRRIKPTKSGRYDFHFNRWIKLPLEPEFEVNG